MLARFERLVEQAVEGSLRRVLPTHLQPVQLAKAAARAMEEAQIIGVRGAEVPNSYELRVALEPSAGIVRLGRAADNDAIIANQRVSRYHAQLRWVESTWLVYDLDSTNGTWVDEQRVFPSQPRALALGGVLRLGDHELRARGE